VISELVSRFGYAVVVLGAFLEGELVLLSAGALVHAGRLHLLPVVLGGAAGSMAWGQAWFHVGRASGTALLARRPAWQSRARRVERWLSNSGLWVLLGGRFVAGMGTVLPSMIGASGFSRRRFSLLDAAGAGLWSMVFSCAGMGVGAAMRRLVERGSPWIWLTAAVAMLVMVAWAWSRVDPRRAAPPTSLSASRKQLIITGDDFGLAPEVNEAIELSHRDGVLTTTSLLVGARAAADAAMRARDNPELRVGLHLALCEGRPCLPAAEVPLLTNARGELLHPVLALVWFLLLGPSARFRRQLEAEIRAQFTAFEAFGLSLDHVNGHNNLQLHPVVLPLLLKVAREHGVRAIRLPYEPLVASWRAARTRPLSRFCVWLVMCGWATLVKRRLLREGFVVNDYLFGIFDCGGMDCNLLQAIIANLPYGLSEIHCHPATGLSPESMRTTPGYLHAAELAALIDPRVRQALSLAGVELISGFGAAYPDSSGSRRAT